MREELIIKILKHMKISNNRSMESCLVSVAAMKLSDNNNMSKVRWEERVQDHIVAKLM